MVSSNPLDPQTMQTAQPGYVPAPGPAEPLPYNFRRPDKFSKDHLRSIQSIQEAFCRFAANFLASKMRAAVHLSLSQIEQSTLGEYVDELPVPTVLFMSALDPLVGQAIIQIDLDLAFLVIDRMLGGSSGDATHTRAGASVTEIEMLLLQDMGRGLIAEFVNAWEQVEPLRSRGCQVALAATQIPELLPSEIALVVRNQVQVLNSTGWLSVCLPASLLEPLMPRLNARLLFANPRTQAGDQAEQALERRMAQVPLSLHVELGRISLRVAELLSIEAGDVIRLDTSADSVLPVVIENRTCFFGQPGQRSGQLAIRIVERSEQADPAEYEDQGISTGQFVGRGAGVGVTGRSEAMPEHAGRTEPEQQHEHGGAQQV